MSAAYAEVMKDHLARYKRDVLLVHDDGIYRRNKRPYAHLLPAELRWLNVLETMRDEFRAYWTEPGSRRRLHPDFHHLNSSQAFAFNLFFPWTRTRASRETLLHALEVGGGAARSGAFEYEPMKGEGTSVDFSLDLGHARVLVEVKLTESSFGACRNDEDHRQKLEQIYARRLAGRVPPASLAPDVFFKRYQLFRNVAHLDAARGDTLVLLLPRANPHAWQEAHQFHAAHLLPAAKPQVRIVAAEDVMQTLSTAAATSERHLVPHMAALREKYLPRG